MAREHLCRTTFRRWAKLSKQSSQKRQQRLPAPAETDGQEQQRQTTSAPTEAGGESSHEGAMDLDGRAKRMRDRATLAAASPGTPRAKRSLAIPPGTPPPSNPPSPPSDDRAAVHPPQGGPSPPEAPAPEPKAETENASSCSAPVPSGNTHAGSESAYSESASSANANAGSEAVGPVMHRMCRLCESYRTRGLRDQELCVCGRCLSEHGNDADLVLERIEAAKKDDEVIRQIRIARGWDPDDR